MENEFYFKTEDLVVWRPRGVLDREKIFDFISFLDQENAKRESDFKRFIDLSNITDVNAEFEELYEIATMRKQMAEKEFKQKVKMGFLVTDTLSFGMARMYENILDSIDYDIGIFYTVKEVAEFLQVDPQLLQQ